MSSNQAPQQFSIYTFMIIMSAIFMTIACILMGIEKTRWPQDESGRTGMVRPLPAMHASPDSEDASRPYC